MPGIAAGSPSMPIAATNSAGVSDRRGPDRSRSIDQLSTATTVVTPGRPRIRVIVLRACLILPGTSLGRIGMSVPPCWTTYKSALDRTKSAV